MPPVNQPANPNVNPGGEEFKQSVEAQPVAAPELPPQPVISPSSQPVGVQQPVQIPNIPQTSQQTAAPAMSSQIASGNTSPQMADDVDVIEKEWVDQADRIIEHTKADPYAEEEAIEQLQIDYLKKRYNHDVKKSDKGQG